MDIIHFLKHLFATPSLPHRHAVHVTHDPRRTMEALAQVKAALDAGLLEPPDFARAQTWFVKVICIL